MLHFQGMLRDGFEIIAKLPKITGYLALFTFFLFANPILCTQQKLYGTVQQQKHKEDRNHESTRDRWAIMEAKNRKLL